MAYLVSVMPLIFLFIHLVLMIFCLSKLLKQEYTNYLSKQLWLFIVMFLGLIGPISYLYLEEWKK